MLGLYSLVSMRNRLMQLQTKQFHLLMQIRMQMHVHQVKLASMYPGGPKNNRILEGQASMTGNIRTRRLNPGWYYLLPEVAAPLGGGLIKLGQAGTWAAVSVGLAPYALLAALYALFIIGYLPAAICCLCSENKRDAAEQLITTSACAIVALLTLTPPAKGTEPKAARRT